jgi:hypothetical protein
MLATRVLPEDRVERIQAFVEDLEHLPSVPDAVAAW